MLSVPPGELPTILQLAIFQCSTARGTVRLQQPSPFAGPPGAPGQHERVRSTNTTRSIDKLSRFQDLRHGHISRCGIPLMPCRFLALLVHRGWLRSGRRAWRPQGRTSAKEVLSTGRCYQQNWPRGGARDPTRKMFLKPSARLRAGVSPALVLIYLVAIPLAFVWPKAADGCYIFKAGMWLVPDRRIEKTAK
jgi:hypothetical protein